VFGDGLKAEPEPVIDRTAKLSVGRQAKVLGISRGSVYYKPRPVSDADLKLMHRIDKLHMEFPFAGSRMLQGLLVQEGFKVGRLHVATLAVVTLLRYALSGSGSGSQFTSTDFIKVLATREIWIIMDGKGAWRDNVFVEPLRRSIKYEESTCGPMPACPKPAPGSVAISASTTAANRSHRFTAGRPIWLTSTRRCLKRWRRNRGGKPLTKRPEPVQINRTTPICPCGYWFPRRRVRRTCAGLSAGIVELVVAGPCLSLQDPLQPFGCAVGCSPV